MPGIGVIKTVLREYGVGWAVNRSLYSLKLKSMVIAPHTEKWYEKRTAFPKRLDLFQLDVGRLQTFLRNELNEAAQQTLLETADKACEGVITGFSSLELRFGMPLDWQCNPLTGKRCDEKKKWYQIPDFENERGDIKVIWEASRFSHFIILARAYLLTGTEKYYVAFHEQLKDWLEKNVYNRGSNFKCGQECAFRMVNTLLAYTVFQEQGIATDADASNVKDLIDRCYRRILNNFFYAYKCIRNNHTISELMGMIVGAWCCGDSKRLDTAYRLLDEVIAEQFMEDGGYLQFSFNYLRLALQDLECVLSVSHRTGKKLSEKSRNRITNAAMLLYQCQDASGDVPNYGSNDGALVFPVTSCGYRDFRPVVNTAYALASGKQLEPDGLHCEELIWFSGGKTAAEFPTEMCERSASQFYEAGLFTLRTPKSWAMVIANDYRSRPAHMDQLHLDLWVDGVNVLCDAGTYSYASEAGRALVRNDSHNTAVVSGKTQMCASGPFLIYRWTRRALCAADDSSIEARVVSQNGYTHLRRLHRVGGSFEITDQVDQDFTIAFHTPCEVSVSGDEARLSYCGKTLCVIHCTAAIERVPSCRSLFYLKQEASSCLLIHGCANTVLKTILEIPKGE